MVTRGERIRDRVWCFTPNPVFETRIESPAGRFVSSAGGKGHNVARQLHQWGVPAISVICDGGVEGEAWMNHAKNEGVRVLKIPVLAGMRQGWALLQRGVERIDFFTEDLQVGKSGWRKIRDFWIRNCKPGDWVVVAGSVPEGAPRGWWRNLLRKLKEKRVRIVVDGKGQLLREALEAGVDWAKANLSEAEETLKQAGTSRCLRSMRTLCRGRSSSLITRGSRGLVLQTGRQRLSLPAPKIRLQDATGSGDVVSAALVYGIRKGWEIEKVAGFAVWAGSEKAARRDTVVLRLKG